MDYNEMILRHSFDDVADEYLCHHGIKGQKWGIRRFQNTDGSLTAAGKARYITDDGHLTDAGRKKYAKDIKKLAKLKERANINIQRQNIEKYDKRADTAKKIGLGAASVAGAMAGVTPLNNLIVNRHDGNVKAYKDAQNSVRQAINKKVDRLSSANFPSFEESRQLNKNIELSKQGARKAFNRLERENGALYKVSDVLDTIERGKKVVGIVAAGAAVGAGATYAYSKYQSHLAKKRVSEIGHQQAVADVKKHMDYMKKAYGDVKLDDLYKKYSK